MLVAAVGLVTVLAVGALAVPAAPDVAFTFEDRRIDESSGLVAASSGDAVYTHDDTSPDGLTYFTVDLGGRTLARTTFPGQDVRDLEDAALGPGPSLYLADIGDNRGVRPRVLVHRLPEPTVDPDRLDRELDGTDLDTTSLTYEDGPRDAEALLVHPRTGQVLVVSKSATRTAVYAAPLPLVDGVLRRVATVSFPPSTTDGGPGLVALARVLVTGGAVSADGRRIVLRTYTDAYVYDVPGDDLVAALATEPVPIPLPATPQGEGVTFTRDGTALLVSTEGRGTPVHRVPVPGAPTPTPTPEPEPAPTTTLPLERVGGLRTGLAGAAAAGVLVAVVALIRQRRQRDRG